MILRIIIDLLIAVSLYFAIAGTIGINKMPDTFSRMQASTLITTLGVLGANIGAILYAIFIMHNGWNFKAEAHPLIEQCFLCISQFRSLFA